FCPEEFLLFCDVVKLLVSRSADKSCKDKQGYTPLHAAAASGHIEIVKYLLRMGAEIILTCFLLSVFPVGHVEVVKLLVSRSADKSCKDKAATISGLLQ
uniref:Uncharacterized protein n=1 Tax=Monopterus albus TaxID=43700 RepID=A0A3Q3JPT3_MONAL